MIKIIFLIIIFLTSCTFNDYNNLSEEDKVKYRPNEIDFKEHSNQKIDVYSIDNFQLDTLVSLNPDKNKIIYFNQVWCEGDMNALKCLLNRNLEDFDLYIISGLDWIWTKGYRNFIDSTHYNHNIYIMDIAKYPPRKALSIGQASLIKYKYFLRDFFDKKTFSRLNKMENFPTFYIVNSKKN